MVSVDGAAALELRPPSWRSGQFVANDEMENQGFE